MTGARIKAIIGHTVGWFFILLGVLAWSTLMPVAWGGYEGFGVEQGLVFLWALLFVALQGIGLACVLAVTGWKTLLGRIVALASALMLIVVVVGMILGAQPA